MASVFSAVKARSTAKGVGGDGWIGEEVLLNHCYGQLERAK